MMLRSHPDKAAIGDIASDQQAKLLNEAREKAKELSAEAIKKKAQQFWRDVDRSDDEKYALAVEEFMMDSSIQEILDSVYEREEEADRVQSICATGAKVVGHSYGAWNPLFADLIKIGATTRQPYIRVAELSNFAGIPEPFQLIASVPSTNPFALEREIHEHFASVRKYGRKKEFFLLSRSALIDHFQTLTERAMLLPPQMKSTKIKRTRVLLTFEKNKAFKKAVSQWIESRIQFSQHGSSFLTTKNIIDAFKRDGHSVPSDTFFFKEIRNQIAQKHPVITYKKINGIRGYYDASFKE